MMRRAEYFFNPDEKRQIMEAIQAAEKNTSGEIRVHKEALVISPQVKVDLGEEEASEASAEADLEAVVPEEAGRSVLRP